MNEKGGEGVEGRGRLRRREERQREREGGRERETMHLLKGMLIIFQKGYISSGCFNLC